jgi:hypothetical protein
MADSKDDELAKKIQAEMELQAEEKIKFDEKFDDEVERISKENLKKEEEEEASLDIAITEFVNLPRNPSLFFRLFSPSRAKNEHFFVKFFYSIFIVLLGGLFLYCVLIFFLYTFNDGYRKYINDSIHILPKK